MPDFPFAIIDLRSESKTDRDYENHPVARVNDHVVRISVMTQAYHWHCHPNSDETFLSFEGGLVIELDDRDIELHPGNMFTVRRGVRHRTRPLAARSVNLTFEREDAETHPLDPPPRTQVDRGRPPDLGQCLRSFPPRVADRKHEADAFSEE
jgi:mannose-6-phosphate isomerase-like protein (cupin superfamily)